MSSIFTKIIAGDIPCQKIAETEDYFAFLDINPWTEGHTLVIPKVEIDYFFDLEDEQIKGLMVFAKKIAKAMDSVMECKRVGVLVEGLEVPHAHVHLIPIYTNMRPERKVELSFAQSAAIAERIRTEFERSLSSQ